MQEVFWHGLHQYEVTGPRSKPEKIRVHSGGNRWRTIWRHPEQRTELVRAILERLAASVRPLRRCDVTMTRAHGGSAAPADGGFRTHPNHF